MEVDMRPPICLAIGTALIFALLSACTPKQPPVQGKWSDYRADKDKVTRDEPRHQP